MTDVTKYFALNLQGFEFCTEVRGSNVMQKYYFIFLLPNFSGTFSTFPSKFVVLESRYLRFSGTTSLYGSSFAEAPTLPQSRDYAAESSLSTNTY